MLNVFVRGHSPKIEPLEWKGAAKWFASELMGKAADRLSLNLELTQFLRGHCGSVTCSDWRKPRHFLVQIETGTCGRRKQLCTLAHEMVHIKQIISGELEVRLGELRWKAKGVLGDFSDEPWELEAWAREAPLYRAYEAFLKKK